MTFNTPELQDSKSICIFGVLIKRTKTMKANKEMINLFNDFETNVICVEDCELHYQGAKITHVVRNDNNKIAFWSGDPDDKFSEEIVVDKHTANQFVKEICTDFD